MGSRSRGNQAMTAASGPNLGSSERGAEAGEWEALRGRCARHQLDKLNAGTQREGGRCRGLASGILPPECPRVRGTRAHRPEQCSVCRCIPSQACEKRGRRQVILATPVRTLWPLCDQGKHRSRRPAEGCRGGWQIIGLGALLAYSKAASDPPALEWANGAENAVPVKSSSRIHIGRS